MIQVSKVKVGRNLKDSIKKAVDLIGGFNKFIEVGDVVLLKPNFNTPDPPPASTDLGFLKSVIELVYSCNPKSVIVAESSTFTLNTRKVMEKLGVFDLQNTDPPPRVYVFEEREWTRKKIAGGKYLRGVSISKLLDQVDKLILLPCLKTHFQAQFTGALKLSVGFMKPSQRLFLHLRNIQEKIAELNKVIYPDLIIADARRCFITKGPSEGQVAEPNLILASQDRIAIDIEGIKIIQGYRGSDLRKIDPWKLPQIKRAVELGIGVRNEKDYQVTAK